MSLPDYPRCPRCHGGLPIERLYSEARVAGKRIRGNTGIVCPACGLRLLVLQGRAEVARMLLSTFVTVVPVILIVLLLDHFSVYVDERWMLGIGLLFWVVAYGAPITLITRYSHRLLELRPLEPEEHGAFPLDNQQHDDLNLFSPGRQLRGLIVAAVGIALVAAILVLRGSLTVPPRASLQSISGSVTDAHRKCSRIVLDLYQCSVWMKLRTNLGEIEVSQDDFTDRGLPVPRTGAAATVLVSPPPRTDEFWEISSGGRRLASYDEVADGVIRHRRRLSVFGYLSGAASIALFAAGIRVGLQSGWRAPP